MNVAHRMGESSPWGRLRPCLLMNGADRIGEGASCLLEGQGAQWGDETGWPHRTQTTRQASRTSTRPNTSHLKPKREKRRQKAPNLANYQKAKKQGAFDVQITRDGCQ